MIYEGPTTSWESTRPNRIAITCFADRQVVRSGPGPEVGVKNGTKSGNFPANESSATQRKISHPQTVLCESNEVSKCLWINCSDNHCCAVLIRVLKKVSLVFFSDDYPCVILSTLLVEKGGGVTQHFVRVSHMRGWAGTTVRWVPHLACAIISRAAAPTQLPRVRDSFLALFGSDFDSLGLQANGAEQWKSKISCRPSHILQKDASGWGGMRPDK